MWASSQSWWRFYLYRLLVQNLGASQSYISTIERGKWNPESPYHRKKRPNCRHSWRRAGDAPRACASEPGVILKLIQAEVAELARPA